MPITDSTGGTLDLREASFFDRPFSPGTLDLLAEEISTWLCSEHLRWLVEHVPGRRDPGEDLELLDWPSELGDPQRAVDSGRLRLARVIDAFREICDWSRPGTMWDYRVDGERPLNTPAGSLTGDALATGVTERSQALGLRSHGRLRTRPRTLVVLGGRRLAPLNRARVAARAIHTEPLDRPVRVVLLSAQRTLDLEERESEDVRSYAAGARTEADLMLAAADRVFGGGAGQPDRPIGHPVEGVHLIEVPAPEGARRASTYETLRFVAPELAADVAAPIGLVTSPTCRPFQYLDAARALGLESGLSFELVAHPRGWAAAPGSQAAAPHVYLQEIRSAIQAAGRLAEELLSHGVAAQPDVQHAALV
jgi:hypothetical protein